MKKSKLFLQKAFLLVCLMTLSLSCSSSDDPKEKEVVDKTVITSLSDKTPYIGQIITIHGKGFNNDKEKNKVLFGDVEAKVINATQTALEVETPYIYSSETLKVSVRNEAFAEASKFLNFTIDIAASDSAEIMNATWEVNNTLKDGAVCKYAKMKIFDTNQTISIVDITIKDDTKIGVGSTSNVLKPTTKICQEVNAFAGINASFFDGNTKNSCDYLRIEGIEVSYGREMNNDGAINAVFVVNGLHDVSFEKVSTTAEARKLEGETLLMAGPMLRQNDQTSDIANSEHNTARHPRSAVGVTKDGHFLMVAVDGRQADAVGVSNKELALIMETLQTTDAMGLDGGGSTTLYMKGYGENGVINTPSNTNAAERVIANIIYAK